MIQLKANVHAIVEDLERGTTWVASGKNLIVDVGLNHIRDLLGSGARRPEYLAVGTGSAATLPADTLLGVEVFRRFVDRRLSGVAQITYQMLLGTADANGNLLAEVGIFTGPVGAATMIGRSLISPAIAKTVSIQVTLQYSITIIAV